MNKTLKQCLYCKKEFKSWKSQKRKFCSPTCSSIYSNKKRKGYNNKVIKCDNCKKYFNSSCGKIKKHIKKKLNHYFCSKVCSSVYKKGDIRLNTSKSLVNAYKEGRLKPNKFKNGGYRKDLKQYFRSGWEANYVRILNYLNIKWIYEPQGFLLNINNKKTVYFPDFYLPKTNEYKEIKGFWFNKLAKLKYEKFSQIYKCKLINEIEYKKLALLYQNKIQWEGRKYE